MVGLDDLRGRFQNTELLRGNLTLPQSKWEQNPRYTRSEISIEIQTKYRRTPHQQSDNSFVEWF